MRIIIFVLFSLYILSLFCSFMACCRLGTGNDSPKNDLLFWKGVKGQVVFGLSAVLCVAVWELIKP